MPSLIGEHYNTTEGIRQRENKLTAFSGRISEIHHIAIRFMRASKSLNSDACKEGFTTIPPGSAQHKHDRLAHAEAILAGALPQTPNASRFPVAFPVSGAWGEAPHLRSGHCVTC